MIRTLDFNTLPAGTVVDDEFTVSDCVTVSATGGSGEAMIFDSSAPAGSASGEDEDLLSDTLGGILIVSEDGDTSDPDDNASGGSIFFDFDDLVRIKSLTFKDIETRDGGDGTRMFFYDADGNVIEEQFVSPTGDGGEATIGLNVPGVARMEVRFEISGAIDNLIWEDNKVPDEGPTAVDDSATTDEDTAIIIDIRGNDTDPNNTNDELTIGSFISADGSVVDNGDGTVTFTPDENFNGDTTFTYIVTDPDGNSDTGEVAITVNPVNDAPVANPDEATTTSGEPVLIDLRGNDTDVETLTELLTITPVDNPNGTIVDNGDGTITFTPNDDFVGETTISYRLEDPDGGFDIGEATVTVNVAPDLGPTAVPDFDETDEDTSVIVDLLGNDTDPDNRNDELSLIAVSVSPDEGTVEDRGDGTVRFTPAENFNGEATISYAIEDPDGNTDDGTAFVTVNPVNDAPVANPDVLVTDEDTPSEPLNVLDNDSDPDGEPLTLDEATSTDGVVTFTPDGNLVFTPNENFNGETTITYVVTDPSGTPSTGTVTVTVNPVNDAPVAVDDTDSTDEDTAITVDLIANDLDVDQPAGVPLEVTAVSVPADQGEVVNNGDGTATFTPAENFNGTATISYTIEDSEGLTSSAEHAILVGMENDAPIANPDTLVTDEDTTSPQINVLANDVDPDGDPLTLDSADSPDGVVEFTEDGLLTFTPDENFNGETTITYVVTDDSGTPSTGTVTVTVNPVNDAPVAVDDVDVTPEDEPITVDLLANDFDVDGDDLTVTSVSVPAEQGTVVDNGDGTATFTPAPDFVGEVTISYTIEDEEGLTDDATHTVYVNEVSDGPTAVDDVAETPEDTPVTIDVLANDTDPDSPELTLLEAEVPEEQGTVEIVDNEVVFTPAPDFNGPVTITYIVQDPDGNEDEGEVAVTVTPVNDAPVAEDDSDVTDLNTPVTVDLLANDSDVDGDDLTVIAASVPAEQGTLGEVQPDGTVEFTPADGFTGDATITYTIEDEEGLTDEAVHVINVSDPAEAPEAVDDTATTPEDTPVTIDVLDNDTDPQGDPLTITEASVPPEQGTVEIVDNELVFTPAENFNGPVEITYTVEDPDGNADEGTATVEVTPVNDAPVAEDDADTTAFNTPVTVDLLANDSDVDGDDLTVTAASVPAEQGTLGEVQPDGTVEFTPADGFTGEATISYTIEDEEGLTDSAEHVVTVENNEGPTAVDDVADTPEDTPVIIDVVGNDVDPEGEPLTVTEASVPEEQGTVEIVDNQVVFTPAPDFNGPATITYTVADPSGEEDEGEVTVDVTPVNDAPDAVDDRDVTDLDTPVTVDLLANDTDPEDDPLTVVAATVPAEQGTLGAVQPDGTVEFTPAPGFLGDATITYTISDAEGEEDTAEHVITVNDPDDAPTAVDDVAETDEDTPVTIDAVANDTDPTDDPLTITDASVPEEQGTVEIVGNELVFTPAEDFTGPAEITYTVEDPDGNADQATVTVDVLPVNDAPDAVDDVATTEEDTPVVIDLVDNDSDPDGDDLTVTAVSVPEEQGTVVDNGDGTATFTPAPDFNGEATVTYTITDGNGGEDTAVHVIDVTPINDAPDAVDDSSETDEETPVIVDLLANDTDPEDDTLTVIDASVPEEQGTLEENDDGTFTFTPAEDFTGEATITYTIEDEGGLRDTAEHTVTVGDVNDAPVAVDDVDVTPEDEPITVDLLANDFDVDGDDLTVTSVSVPAEQGTVVDNGDGTATFTPAPDFVGEVTISYTIEDEEGLTDDATHTVYVNEVSDGPTAVDDVAETPEDTPVTIDVLANDTDPDSPELTLLEAEVPEEQGTVEIVDNEVVFTPAPDFNGPVTITYIVQDPDGNEDEGEVAVTVTPVNDAPVAEDDSDVTDLNTPVTVDLLANDSDVDGDDLTVIAASVPAEQGTLGEVQPDGTVEFTPADGFTGDATITYTIEDEEGLTDEAVHVINVSDPAEAPEAVDDTATTPEDTPVTIDVLDNDTDPQGDPLTITEASVPPEQGTVEIVDNELVFTPAENFNGPVEITYTVEDPDGNADEGTATVEVTPVNDAPVAEDDADTTAFNTPVTVDLLANDSDVDGDDLTVTAASVPAEQGTLGEVQPDGTVEFTPADGFTGEATISYTIEDEEGLTDSAEHVVTVENNEGPTAVDDVADTPEDTPVIIDVVGNDVDPEGEPLTVTEASVPEEQGTVEIVDNQVVFTPAPDFNGPATITYTVADPSGEEDEGEVTVDVTPVNDAPDAVDDRDVTDLDTPVTVDLLANDTDPEDDPLTVVAATVPAEQGTLGAVQPDGTVEFTPAPGFLGDATITYTISDAEGEEDTAEHVITVNDPDDAPTAVDDVAETDEDTPVTIDAVANDTDPTDDPLTITDASVPEEQGTVEIVGNELVFTPAEDFTGPAEITYTVEDPDGNADQATVTVDVLPVNDAPDAVDDVATTEEDTPVVIDLVDNDSDPDGDDLTVTAVSVPEEQGTVVDNGDGTATFTPAPDFNGEATVTYTITDGNGGEDTAVHVIDVTPINDAPDAVDDSSETDEETPVIVDLLANDTDPEDDTLTVIDASVPEEQGTLEENDDGTFTFTPAEDFTGEATITYTIEDEGGLRDTAEHTVTVGDADNDPPVAVDDTAETPEDTPVIVDLRGNDTDPDDDLEDLVISGLSVPPEQGTVVDNEDGTVTFTPAPNFNGTATISYTLTDPDGASDTGEAVVTVTPVNDAPVAEDDTVSTGFNEPIVISPLGNDSDVDGDPLRVVSATSPNGTVVVNPDNTVTFTPNTGFNGTADISYTISDRPEGDPDALTDDATVNVLIPCFTPGTKIATPKGERLVEDLQVGDRVITRDNGIQEIRWVGARDMSGADLEKSAHLKPVLIQAGALGNDLPERDMMVSPNHRILVANDKTALYFEEREVLVAAKHLTGLDGVDIVDVSHTTYIHIMFDQHEVILSDGAWTESFQPGDMSLVGVGNAQRQEILELFPELATQEGIDAYASARRSLKKHEAKLITK